MTASPYFLNHVPPQVLYTNQDFQPHHAVWSSNTCHQGTGPFRLVMQPDNNLVIYDSHNHGALELQSLDMLTLLDAATWSTNSCGRGRGPCRFELQNDRNAVLYAQGHEVLWASNTCNGEPCSVPDLSPAVSRRD